MSRTFQGLFLLILSALLIGGIVVLLQWRLDKGDAYPRYSTLRADPLGTRAFCETFKRLYPANSVKQNFIPLGRDEVAVGTTWFFLGSSLSDFLNEAADSHLRRVLSKGGDAIIALSQGGYITTLEEDDEEKESKRRETEERRPGWLMTDVRINRLIQKGELSIDATYSGDDAAAWPDIYKSRSPMAFDPLPRGWSPKYVKDGKALIIDRRVGRGTLTLVNDSFAFSNEALFNQRQSAFLQAIAGSNQRFIFDETHLGTSHHRGVMDLIKDYRLQGVLVSFLILSLLYIWRSGSSLLPPLRDASVDGDHLLGESSNEGFQHFLAHHLSGDDVVKQCLLEWERSWGNQPQHDPVLAEQIEQALTAFEKARETTASPVTKYNQLTKILTRKHLF